MQSVKEGASELTLNGIIKAVIAAFAIGWTFDKHFGLSAGPYLRTHGSKSFQSLFELLNDIHIVRNGFQYASKLRYSIKPCFTKTDLLKQGNQDVDVLGLFSIRSIRQILKK